MCRRSALPDAPAGAGAPAGQRAAAACCKCCSVRLTPHCNSLPRQCCTLIASLAEAARAARPRLIIIITYLLEPSPPCSPRPRRRSPCCWRRRHHDRRRPPPLRSSCACPLAFRILGSKRRRGPARHNSWAALLRVCCGGGGSPRRAHPPPAERVLLLRSRRLRRSPLAGTPAAGIAVRPSVRCAFAQVRPHPAAGARLPSSRAGPLASSLARTAARACGRALLPPPRVRLASLLGVKDREVQHAAVDAADPQRDTAAPLCTKTHTSLALREQEPPAVCAVESAGERASEREAISADLKEELRSWVWVPSQHGRLRASFDTQRQTQRMRKRTKSEGPVCAHMHRGL